MVETKKLEDPLTLYGLSFASRLLLGTARYDSPSLPAASSTAWMVLRAGTLT
jgi:thiazole synthase ThiGH ThiG subunit